MSIRFIVIISIAILSSLVTRALGQSNSRIFFNSKFQTYASDSTHHSYFTDAFLKVVQSNGGDDGVIDLKEMLDILNNNKLKADTSLVNKAKKNENKFFFNSKLEKGKANNYALIVFLEKFDKYPELMGPQRDATILQDELEKKFGFNVESLANPTKNEFLLKLRSYTQIDFKKEGQLLIYFVSRGSYDVLLNRDYLVFKDSDPEDELKLSFIPHTQLQSLATNFAVENLMLIIDAGAR